MTKAICACRAELGDLAAHLTNTCHLKREGGAEDEAAVVRLLSELPQMLAEEGMESGEAQRRVQQATTDMHAILGMCSCTGWDLCMPCCT